MLSKKLWMHKNDSTLVQVYARHYAEDDNDFLGELMLMI